jgi:hypothetical protein
MTSQPTASGGAFEIEHALVSTLLVNAFGSFYWTSVLLNLAPWRSTLLGAGLVTVATLEWDLERAAPFRSLGLGRSRRCCLSRS